LKFTIFAEKDDRMEDLNLELTRALVNDICRWYKDFVIAEQARNGVEGHLFNVFALWNRLSGIGETLHSRLLHFLLSDDSMHGQKDKFLIKFLEMAGIENPNDGKWTVTAECGRVDIRIVRHNPHSVVVIENKSNRAEDQSNQLYRYWYENMYAPERTYDGSRYKIIYLSPSADKKFDDQTCCKPSKEWFFEKGRCDYDQLPDKIPLKPEIWYFNDHIQKWLELCIDALAETNQPLRNYLNQYKEYCKKL